MSNEKGFSAGSVILAFLVGGLTGAAVALLFAPQTGKQTRDKINDLAGDVSEKAEKLAKSLRSGVKDAMEYGKETIEEKKKLITAAYEAGLGAVKK
jgi:gas vesicle protein